MKEVLHLINRLGHLDRLCVLDIVVFFVCIFAYQRSCLFPMGIPCSDSYTFFYVLYSWFDPNPGIIICTFLRLSV